MNQVWQFNQGTEVIRDAVPFAGGTCLRLAHEWLVSNAAGKPFDPATLKTSRICNDQESYLVSGDKLLTSRKLASRTVWDSLTKLSAFALALWGGGRFSYEPGLQSFSDLYARTPTASGILCVYGKDASGGRWGHAMAALDGETLFDPNTGEWELSGMPGARARDLDVYCNGRDILMFPGDVLKGVRFILYSR